MITYKNIFGVERSILEDYEPEGHEIINVATVLLQLESGRFFPNMRNHCRNSFICCEFANR